MASLLGLTAWQILTGAAYAQTLGPESSSAPGVGAATLPRASFPAAARSLRRQVRLHGAGRDQHPVGSIQASQLNQIADARGRHSEKPPPPAAPSMMAVSRPIKGSDGQTISGSDFSRLVAVDFQADADLDESSRAPTNKINNLHDLLQSSGSHKGPSGSIREALPDRTSAPVPLCGPHRVKESDYLDRGAIYPGYCCSG